MSHSFPFQKLEKQTDKSAEVSKMSQELDSKALALQKLAKELGDVRAENQVRHSPYFTLKHLFKALLQS